MSLSSSYLRNSLPSRSPSQRPRAQSLSEYQPLSFDREALEAAYQQTLGLPSSSAASSRSIPSWSSFPVSGWGSSEDTHETGATSMLSNEIKPGDNPHEPPAQDAPSIRHAGLGAGHSLTPPHSPFHSAGLNHHSTALSPVPGSPKFPMPPPRSAAVRRSSKPPTPPPRPTGVPASTFGPATEPHPGIGMRRNASAMDVDEGYLTDPGVSNRARGKRRALPALPTNVPVPEPPQWEPDIKPHIPSELTQPSIANAYARLSAPPPNLPNRNQPSDTPISPPRRSTRNMGLARTAEARAQANEGPSMQLPAEASSSSTNQPDIPRNEEPMIVDSPTLPTLPTTPERPRPATEKEVFLRATDKTTIWSTHYLDPCLHSSFVNVPHQVTNVANIALTGLSSGSKTRYNSSVGAPIDGLARAAKEWIVPADAKFVSELGGIEVGVAVVDGGGDAWGKEKGRKKARVEAISKQGGIKIDLIDMRIETKAGDVLVLLPDTFHGPIHVTAPSHAPQFLPILLPQLEPVVNPYGAFYTTFATPLHLRNDPSFKQPLEHRTASGIQNYSPKSFRQQSDLFDQVVAGYASHTRGEQSKVTVQCTKGRVVIGYRNGADEEGARGMGLIVGHQGTQKKKRWWR